MKNFNPTNSEMQAILDDIQECAGYRFKDPCLLMTALTHSSYAAECTRPVECNERLEFLGDAVLELVVSHALYLSYPREQEGRLSFFRALLVDENATSAYALKLGLDRAMLLSKGGQKHGDRQRKSILGDAFEAFLGAVFLDGGLPPAVAIVQRLIPETEAGIDQIARLANPKGQVQDHCQRNTPRQHPEYVVVENSGPIHDPHFTVELRIDGTAVSRGTGSSKRNAEQAAAAAAIAIWEQKESEGN